jgi:hypothetical protein
MHTCSGTARRAQARKGAGAAIHIMDCQRVGLASIAHETIGLLRRVRSPTVRASQARIEHECMGVMRRLLLNAEQGILRI